MTMANVSDAHINGTYIVLICWYFDSPKCGPLGCNGRSVIPEWWPPTWWGGQSSQWHLHWELTWLSDRVWWWTSESDQVSSFLWVPNCLNWPMFREHFEALSTRQAISQSRNPMACSPIYSRETSPTSNQSTTINNTARHVEYGVLFSSNNGLLVRILAPFLGTFPWLMTFKSQSSHHYPRPWLCELWTCRL